MKTLVALILAKAMATVAVAGGFVENPRNGHLYKAVYVPGGISWSDAKVAAEKAGGYLATITSMDEQKFIHYRVVNDERLWLLATPYDNFGPWIGGYQERGAREPDGGWKWVTGENFFFSCWASMEPSGRWKGKNENRLHLYCKSSPRKGTKWNDMLDDPDDQAICGYVIEKGATDTGSAEPLLTAPPQEFHDFLGANGKSCRGRILGYDPNSDSVTIEKENKRSYTGALSHFSEADQTYVREWHLVKELCTPKRVRIAAKQIQVGDEREIEYHDNQGNQRCLQTMVNHAYSVTLDNRTSSDLNNLTVEYCIYYEQERPSPHGPRTAKGVQCGTLPTGTLAGRTKATDETEHVVLSKRRFINYNGNAVLKGKIEGIWIRVFLPLANGQKAMRECSIPKTLMKDRQWATSDIIVE
ncbi:lectin-like protein [Pontiellaceae bacterium B12227]|nr:lectin-like protein [Pontiellaceae bacterium B12227]